MVNKRNQDDRAEVMEKQGDRSEEAVANDVGLVQPERDEGEAESDETVQEDDAD